MEKMSSIKRACITAVCIALACVLPLAFHSLGLGSALSPMHIPVLLCGMVCGGGYGMFCGIASPILSCAMSGMPGPSQLIAMAPELAVYGLVTGVLFRRVRTKNQYADMYLALLSAMLLGRVAGGIASALLYFGRGEGFTVALWASSYFVGTAPGIVSQLILVPALILALERAGILPRRYPGTPPAGKTENKQPVS